MSRISSRQRNGVEMVDPVANELARLYKVIDDLDSKFKDPARAVCELQLAAEELAAQSKRWADRLGSIERRIAVIEKAMKLYKYTRKSWWSWLVT